MNPATLSSRIFSATLFLALSGLRAAPVVPSGPVAPPAAAPAPGAPEAPLLAAPSAASRDLTPEEAEVLKRYDKNGDGRLDEDERMAAHQVVTRMALGARVGQVVYTRLLATFDREHRGYLTPAEQAQAIVYLQRERPILYQALVRRFDRNRDGTLDAGETDTLFRALQRLARRPGKVAKQ